MKFLKMQKIQTSNAKINLVGGLIIVISLCEGENLDGWTLLHISKN
jgi:hypothetical protein